MSCCGMGSPMRVGSPAPAPAGALRRPSRALCDPLQPVAIVSSAILSIRLSNPLGSQTNYPVDSWPRMFPQRNCSFVSAIGLAVERRSK